MNVDNDPRPTRGASWRNAYNLVWVVAVVLFAGNLLMDGVTPVALVALVALVGTSAHVVAHELAHLLLALILRLPVREVAIGANSRTVTRRLGSTAVRIGLGGSVNRVVVGLPAHDGQLPIRMIVVLFAGSATNLAIASVCMVTASQATSPLISMVLQLLAIEGIVLGGANLVPLRFGSHTTDGARIIAWVRRPEQLSAQLAAQDRKEQIRRLIRAQRAGAAVDLHELRKLCGDADPWVADRAAALLLQIIVAAGWKSLLAEEQTMRAYALRPDANRDITLPIFHHLGWTLALFRLGESEPRAEDLRNLATFAEHGMVNHPDSLGIRAVLGLVRLVERRPADARELLAGTELTQAEPYLRCRALAVQAMAACALGDLSGARRLIATAEEIGKEPALIRFVMTRIARREADSQSPASNRSGDQIDPIDSVAGWVPGQRVDLDGDNRSSSG